MLERVGREYGVSPYFIAGASGTESSYGAASCSNNPRNIWGLAACDGRWYVPYFDTWEEAFSFYAAFLNKQWPGHSSSYSFPGYSECDACWGRKTAEHMALLFGGVGNGTRYP